MKNLILLAALASALSAVAAKPAAAKPAAAKPAGTNAVSKLSGRERFQRMQMRQFGGFVNDTRAQKGCVVVVNAQSAAPAAWFAEVIESFDKMAKVAFRVQPGAFDLAAPKLAGTVTVFVADDPKLPMSLIAPEAKWAMVNVAPLKTAKEPFFQARVRKELTRVFAYLLGAADSQYPMCLTGCVTKPADLDQFVYTSKLPMDLQLRLEKYIPSLGLVPYKVSTYKNACIEGWAAQPTNEFQKAIWDKVHEAPTKPIVIKPEPKKGK